jgi:hypothetical protein
MEVLRGGTGEVFICRCRGAEMQIWSTSSEVYRCRITEGAMVQRCRLRC